MDPALKFCARCAWQASPLDGPSPACGSGHLVYRRLYWDGRGGPGMPLPFSQVHVQGGTGACLPTSEPLWDALVLGDQPEVRKVG